MMEGHLENQEDFKYARDQSPIHDDYQQPRGSDHTSSRQTEFPPRDAEGQSPGLSITSHAENTSDAGVCVSSLPTPNKQGEELKDDDNQNTSTTNNLNNDEHISPTREQVEANTEKTEDGFDSGGMGKRETIKHPIAEVDTRFVPAGGDAKIGECHVLSNVLALSRCRHELTPLHSCLSHTPKSFLISFLCPMMMVLSSSFNKPADLISHTSRSVAQIARDHNMKWAVFANEAYQLKTNKYDSNLSSIKDVFAEHEELLAPLLTRCPMFSCVISEMFVNKLRFSAKEVDYRLKTEDWGVEECRKVGMSMSPYLKDTQTGEAALHGWKLNYPQIETLFDEIEGFEAFMLVITNNLLRDSNYGMVFRVATGAVLSTIDGITDIYVINSYYNTDGLHGQANAMLAMLTTNIIIQLLFVLVQYKKKNWKVKVREALICLFFLRPAIDAYRVSTNHEDEETTLSQLTEMVCTKVRIWNCAYSESFSYS